MKRKTSKPARSKDLGAARLVVGGALGLLGLLGAAVVLRPAPGGKVATGGKSGGVPLTVNGERAVGMASEIPASVGFDTGPIDFTHNAPGWDFAQLGGKL